MHDTSLELPTRSTDGAAALDIFYIDFNEVNFYFEDCDQENLYEEIVRKILPEISFSRVFPLNGKSSVLSHAQDPTNKSIIKNPVYVLDKDFDDLLGKIVHQANIFYLDRYCIENHLIDEDALIKVVIETHPKLKYSEIKRNIALEKFLESNKRELTRLFKAFFCVQKLGLGIKNCSYPPEEFSVKNSPHTIDAEKVDLYIKKSTEVASKEKLQPPLIDPLNDPRTLIPDTTPIDSIVSGKFLITIIFHHIKEKYKLGSITIDSFVFRSMKNSDLPTLQNTANKIKEYLSTPQH